MYKAFIPVFISLLCVFAGCTYGEMPTDKAMIAHFTENEAAFVRLQHLIGENLPGEHYPAFDHDPDSSRLSMIPVEKKAVLDSLLKVVGVERVFYTGTDTQPEFMQDTIYSKRIEFLYYSFGLSISGGAKKYVYAPHLKEKISQSQACEDSEYYIRKIVSEDLDELSETYSQDVELYRPIKDDWYICLERNN